MEPHIPKKLPIGNLDWVEFVSVIGKANYNLAHYDGMLRGMPNPVLLSAPLSAQEAVMSSRIEGTQVSLQDVYEYQASPVERERASSAAQDTKEIVNHIEATSYAWKHIAGGKPISLNLIKEIHFILCDSVRGRDKARGEFRREQNYIAPIGTPFEKATYAPPPPEIVMDLLSNLEYYIHSEERDKLVQLAIVHAQFEIIHPFLDGNGRVGRILVPLFLLENQLLSYPVFYISAYFEENREEYYHYLNRITTDGEWNEWVKFFLNAVIHQSQSNANKVQDIINLYNDIKQKLMEALNSQYIIPTLDTIFARPLFSTPEFVRASSIPRPSVPRILSNLAKHDILTIRRKGVGGRATIWELKPLMDILR